MDFNKELILQLLESNPEQALIELRRLFCHAKREGSQQVHEIAYLIAKTLFKLTQFDAVRRLVDYWLANYSLESNLEMRMQNILAVVYNLMGHIPDAFTYYSEVLKKAVFINDIEIQAFVYNNLGRMMNEVGAYDKSREFYQKLLPLVRDQPFEKARADLFYASTLLHLNEPEEAYSILDQAQLTFEQLDDLLRLGYLLEVRGDFALYHHDNEKALFYYNQALLYLNIYGDNRTVGTLQQKRAALLTKMNKYYEAIKAYKIAIKSINAANVPLIIKDSYYQLALCYETTGQGKLAIEAYKSQNFYLKASQKIQAEQQIRMIDIHLERADRIKEKEHVELKQFQLENTHYQMLGETESIGIATSKIQQLKQLTLALTSARNNQEIQKIAIDYLDNIMSYERFSLGLIDESNDMIAFDAVYLGTEPQAGLTISMDQPGYCQHAVFTGQIINLSNANVTSFFMEHKEDQQNAAIYVPLKESGQVFGVCVVYNHLQGTFDAYDEAVFVGFCSAIASAITILKKNAAIRLQKDLHHKLLEDLKLKNAELSHLSYHDTLTGLYNRAGMAYCIDQWLMSTPLPCEMVVAVMDIDHFKQFNDQFGHMMGDKLLKQMGNMIKRVFTKNDYLLTRFGGEEFLLIASGRYFGEIIKGSEQLRVSMPELTEFLSIDATLSISVGIKNDFIMTKDDLYNLIDGADQQLYRAKQTGRNKVCSA